jgi:hypothetical protein
MRALSRICAIPARDISIANGASHCSLYRFFVVHRAPRLSHDDATAVINFKKSRLDIPRLLLVEPPRLISITSPETYVCMGQEEEVGVLKKL